MEKKKALLADNAGTFHAFKSLFGFGHVFSFVAVNCFTFWNLVWICEGFWQIFALECALCCCMLIVIGQWTLTLACLAYPAYFGSDPHKGFGSSWKGSERIESTRIWNKALVQKERLKRNSRIMKKITLYTHNYDFFPSIFGVFAWVLVLMLQRSPHS